MFVPSSDLKIDVRTHSHVSNRDTIRQIVVSIHVGGIIPLQFSLSRGMKILTKKKLDVSYRALTLSAHLLSDLTLPRPPQGKTNSTYKTIYNKKKPWTITIHKEASPPSSLASPSPSLHGATAHCRHCFPPST